MLTFELKSGLQSDGRQQPDIDGLELVSSDHQHFSSINLFKILLITINLFTWRLITIIMIIIIIITSRHHHCHYHRRRCRHLDLAIPVTRTTFFLKIAGCKCLFIQLIF